MGNLHSLMDGFSVALTYHHILIMVAGVLLGLVVGVLPGLGAPNGVSLLLPLTFTMDPVSAIILLTSMYWGALFGGSTTSILFNIPGEPSSVATTFDGYPMAQRGSAGRALTLAFSSAGFGALAGVVVITLLSGWMARFAIKFGPAEFFAVYFIAFAGIYVASAAYLMWALRIQHRLAVWRSALVAAATVLTLYWLFERTFDVALPHGWIAGALGL